MPDRNNKRPPPGPRGTCLRAGGKDGPQLVRSRGHRWTDEAETIFLDVLAATNNATFAAVQCGFSTEAIYARARRDPGFARRMAEARTIAYGRLDEALARAAEAFVAGDAPDPDSPLPKMTIGDAIAILKLNRPAQTGEGRRPAWPALVTTTPRPGPHLRRIMESPRCAVTGGPTSANPHVSELWQQGMADLYAGTRLGRQELEGELLTDSPGALWTVELLERCRTPFVIARSEATRQSMAADGTGAETGLLRSARNDEPAQHSVPPRESTTFTRVIVAVDPPAADGTCGIIACARDGQGRAHVLADHSVTARSPEGWARAVADAAAIHGTNEVVAEQNQGGKMVAAVLRTADPTLRVKLVTATVGKSERAAPVAMLFEAGKVTLHGRFPELEAELMGMIAGGEYEPAWSGGPGGPGTSPDRADAMVWGLTELMLEKERAEPRIRTF